MIIYIDGDACPVKDIIIELGSIYKIPVHLFIDTSHSYSNPNIMVTIVDKGPDSVDFAIMRLIKENDLLITQDYGLSSLAISKGAIVLHPCGKIININNIDTNIKSGIININSLLTGNNHIELKSGTVNLNLKGDDYRFKTTRISGIISINEERENVNSNGNTFIDIEVISGTVNVLTKW